MKAIILAAGQGTRLRPLTLNKPKCLVEVAGHSLLDLQIKILRTVGIKEIIIVGGYLVSSLSGKGDKLIVNNDYKHTNMVSSLFCASDHLFGEVIISYGDIIYSPSILQKLKKEKSEITIVSDLGWREYWLARSNNPISDLESFRVDKKKNILNIGQSVKNLEEIQGQYIGLMKFRSEGLKMLLESYDHFIEKNEILGKYPEEAYVTDLIQAMIEKGSEIKALEVKEPWIEVDTIQDLDSKITKRRVDYIFSELCEIIGNQEP